MEAPAETPCFEKQPDNELLVVPSLSKFTKPDTSSAMSSQEAVIADKSTVKSGSVSKDSSSDDDHVTSSNKGGTAKNARANY